MIDFKLILNVIIALFIYNIFIKAIAYNFFKAIINTDNGKEILRKTFREKVEEKKDI